MGTPHDVLELLGEPSKEDRHPPQSVRRLKIKGRLARDPAEVGYGIQQKLREGFSSAESFLSVSEPAFDPEIRISRCYHDPLNRLRIFCLAF